MALNSNCSPLIVPNGGDGRLQVFVFGQLGPEGTALWQRSQETCTGPTTWAPWVTLDGPWSFPPPVSPPLSAGLTFDQRIEVFVAGATG